MKRLAGKRGGVEYDPWGIVPPKRGKRGTFAPWERNVLDPTLSGGNDASASEWVLIHPTPRTRMFKEILLGEFGYTEGQGVYNSVRSTETAIRQIQATILTNTLDAVRYEELRRDWEEHAVGRSADPASLAERYGSLGEGEAVAVAERVFDTWRRTLQSALLDMIRGVAACFSSGEPDSAVSFSKYIDWICCLGMVPMIRGKQARGKREGERDSQRAPRGSYRDIVAQDAADNMEVAHSVLARGKAVASELADCVEAVTIMEYDRAIIEYNFSKREVRAKDAVTGEKGECIVVWRPVMRNGGVIFDSPLQRLYAEVMACHALRRHVDVCRVVNTAPVKVVLGKKSDDERGVAGARKAVEKALGETAGGSGAAAGSAAARLVRLIINMKGMKHVGDITETVREYLEETGGHLLDTSVVDTSQAGFGRAHRPGPSGSRGSGPGGSTTDGFGGPTRIKDAFQASVVGSINGMLEGYINKLFGSVENLEAANADLTARIRRKDAEIWKLRETALRSKQAEADARSEARARSHYGADKLLEDDDAAARLADLGRDVIDVSDNMNDDTYVANTFQSRYVPSYDGDLTRLSSLWEQELIRCFKMTRLTNHQGHETSVSYSNSAITLLVAPYFFSILQVRRLGFLVTTQEAYRSEEELCSGIFEKSRLETYLQDIGAIFVADVKRAVAVASMPTYMEGEAPAERDDEDEDSMGGDAYAGGTERRPAFANKAWRGGNEGGYGRDPEGATSLLYSAGRASRQDRRPGRPYSASARGPKRGVADARSEVPDRSGQYGDGNGRYPRPPPEQRYAGRSVGLRRRR